RYAAANRGNAFVVVLLIGPSAKRRPPITLKSAGAISGIGFAAYAARAGSSSGFGVVVSKPARLRFCASDKPPFTSNRSPALSVRRWLTCQSSCRKNACIVCVHSPGDAISNWLDAVPGVATAPVADVGRPRRNCANDCARSPVAAGLLARGEKPVDAKGA